MAKTIRLNSTAVGRRRLLKLATLLESDAKNEEGIRFDFSNWGYVGDPANPVSCGTSACAMGLAAVSGAFQRQGLKCRVKRNGWIEISLGRTKSPLRAAARLFQISEGQAYYLFSRSYDLPESYGSRGELAAAKRIRNFCGLPRRPVDAGLQLANQIIRGGDDVPLRRGG